MVRVCRAHLERTVLTNICSDVRLPNPDGYRTYRHSTQITRHEPSSEKARTEIIQSTLREGILRDMGYD